MSRTLRFECVYPYPIETVWAAITDPVAISEWLMPNDFKAEVGHEFQFRSQPQGNWDGIVYCKVLRVDAPHDLVYSWYNKQINTELSFHLESVAGGTRLELVHSGFSGFFATMLSVLMGSGWKRIVHVQLAGVLEKLSRGEALSGKPMCKA
ncbi:SRPBCC domain-containing protein [bacterium]|nr:SRPBCC domain-containing protein [bacterium]